MSSLNDIPSATVTSYAGLKASCRHIASQDGVQDKLRFAVGTTIVGKTNQIQIIEYDENKGTVQCIQSFDHKEEVWWICCHPKEEYQNKMFTISSIHNSADTQTRIFTLPDPYLSNVASGNETSPLTLDATFNFPDPHAKRVFVLPAGSEEKCVISGKSSFSIFDIDRPDTPNITINSPEGSVMNACAADSLHTNIIAACCGSDILLWDVRSNNIVYQIPKAHSPTALDVAFNENKPWWICSGGTDGFLKCWDAKAGKMACKYKASSHWVTRTIPSVSHEQLILTTGTDSKVRIFNASAFALQNEGKLSDGKVIKNIRQDDSVYSAAWATSSPWVFASVSYKGQVNVCQLPTQVVDAILMGDDS